MNTKNTNLQDINIDLAQSSTLTKNYKQENFNKFTSPDKKTLMDDTDHTIDNLNINEEQSGSQFRAKKGENEEGEDLDISSEDEYDKPKLLYNGQHCIVEKHETNKWLVYNQHIQYGYRTNYSNKRILLKSACTCHNETVNVWTHALGGIFLIGLAFYTIWFWTPLRLEHTQFRSRMKQKNWGDFSNANNYDDIINFFAALTEQKIAGFNVYSKLNTLWENNSNLFNIGSDEFSKGISLVQNTFTSYFKLKASLLPADINAFKFLFSKVSFY